MAKQYTVTPMLGIVNAVFKFLLKRGLGPPKSYLLTVRGRKTGKPYSIPVSPLEQDGVRYIVSPYGEVGWVKNARASGEVTLSRGSQSETVKVEEMPPEETGVLLKTYYDREKAYVAPYFDVNENSSLEMFTAEAAQHPVFRVVTA